MTAQQRSGNQPGSLATGQRVTTAQQSSKKQPASRARGQRARVGGRRGQPARGGRGRRGPAAGSVGVVLPGGREAGGRGFGGVPGPPPIFKEEVRIVADETTNSLIVLAVKPDYEKVLEVLRKIDVVPRQVVIEVVIAEITLDKSLEFGVDHAIKAGNLLGEAPAGDKLDSWIYSSRPSGVGALPEGAKDPLRRSILALKDPGGGGLAAYIVKPGKFAAILKALADRSLVKILSAPHVIAADNQEAHIQVGESIPVLTSSSQSTLANANVVNQVQYRDVGTILTILPQVNSAGLVNMQVSQEVSKVSERQIEGIESPAFLTREAETTLVVQNGDSILIGGIIEEQKDTIRSGIPFIMDIPVLGRLFRFEKAAVKRTELLVLITPHVIRNRDEALSVTDEFTRVIRGLDRLLERRRGSSRFPGDEESFQSKGADRL